MRKILFLLLFTIASYGQAVFDEGIQIKNNTTDNSATKVNVQSTDGTINTISKSDLVNVVEVNDVPSLPLTGVADKIYVVKNINKIYRWNGTFYQELAVSDISGLQAQIDLKANNSDVVKLTGDQTISGQKSFSLTGKIDMKTDNAFPAITATALGSNAWYAASFINNSSYPYSSALILQTSLSGGVGNRALDVSNQSPIGTGIFSNASNGGVSISSESHNGDSYVSNIAYGGTGRNYVGRNNGTETYSVDKIGNVLGNSYIKRSTPANNILLAGGGDLAQGTAFNKNFGLNTGDVVGATTLLNQYSTTPIDWTATAFNSGQVVFYGGKQWIAKMATVAGDVPSVSSKWEEITFEATQTALDAKASEKKASKGLISGDSTIAQYLTQSSVSSFLLTPFDVSNGCSITDISVPGNTILQQKTAYEALNDKNTYDWVIVQIGLNDTDPSELASVAIARLQSYINSINSFKKSDCKVIISVMNPIKARFRTLYGDAQWMVAYNKWKSMNEAISGFGSNPITGVSYRVINHARLLKDDVDNLASIYDIGDFVHENNTAREIIANEYRSALINLGFFKSSQPLKSPFYDYKGGKFSGTLAFDNSNAGIFFNSAILNNQNVFLNDGWAYGINSDNIGRIHFSISQSQNVNKYGALATFKNMLSYSSVGIGINGASIIGSLNIKQGPNLNLTVLSGDIDATAIQFNAFNDAGNANIPIEYKASKFIFNVSNSEAVRINESKQLLIGQNTDNGSGSIVQVNGTISASPATTANQVVVKSQLDAVAARPYKVYTVNMNQISTSAPTIVTTYENTLGGSIVWTRIGVGDYRGTLTGAFTSLKTVAFTSLAGAVSMTPLFINGERVSNNEIRITTYNGMTPTDGLMTNAIIEFRVYN